MGKVKFQLNLPGLNELMKSAEMQGVLSEATQAVASRAEGMATTPGAKYTADVVVGKFVAIGRVHAGNTPALKENYDRNTMVKALDSTGLGM